MAKKNIPTAGSPKSKAPGLFPLIGYLVVLPLAAALFFLLPWHIPVKGPMVSESYTFGFSNVTSFLVLALTLLALFVLRLFSSGLGERDRRLGQSLFIPPQPRTLGQTLTLGLSIALSWLVVGGWWSLIPYGYFGEAIYFMTRLDRLTLGQMPFKDFDFGYGPAMLWLPYLLQKVTGGSLPMDTAYLLTVLLHYALGLLALDYLLRSLRLSGTWRAVLLVFGLLSGLNLTLGVIYTPLRFVFTAWAVVALHHAQQSGSAWKGWAAALGLPFLGLLLSPDCGLVTSLASFGGLLWYLRLGERAKAFRALAVVVAMAGVAALFGADYFGQILFFGGGAMNFPILPAPYIISILVSACWLLPRIAVMGWTGSDKNAPLSFSLLLAMGLFLPAALGRCDPGHVLLNGLMVLIVAVAASLQEKSWLPRGVTALAALTVFTTTQISFWNHYDVQVNNVFESRKNLAAAEAAIKEGEEAVRVGLEQARVHNPFHWSKRFPFSPDLLTLLRYDKIGTPVGVSEDIDRFLKVSGRYIPDYFVPPLGGTFNPELVARKIAGMQNTQILLVPDSIGNNLQPVDHEPYAAWWSEFMGKLFVYPVELSVVHDPFVPEALLCRWLVNDFEIEGRFRNYVLLRRKKIPATP